VRVLRLWVTAQAVGNARNEANVAVKEKIFAIAGLWPAATIGVGVGLTLVWITIIIWVFLKIVF
jgi:hypothetical protein